MQKCKRPQKNFSGYVSKGLTGIPGLVYSFIPTIYIALFQNLLRGTLSSATGTKLRKWYVGGSRLNIPEK